jgi:hypothetical protein
MPLSPVSARADARAEPPPTLGSSRPFWERLSEEVGAAIDAGHPCSLLVLEPNDDCACLPDLIAALVASRAAAFRLADDRFGVLLARMPLASALSLARLLELRLAFRSEGKARVAIGAASLDGQTDSPEELFARAHLAMLEAKQFAAPTALAFGHSCPRPAPPNAAGTARLLADLSTFDLLLDASPRTAANEEPLAGPGLAAIKRLVTAVL